MWLFWLFPLQETWWGPGGGLRQLWRLWPSFIGNQLPKISVFAVFGVAAQKREGRFSPVAAYVSLASVLIQLHLLEHGRFISSTVRYEPPSSNQYTWDRAPSVVQRCSRRSTSTSETTRCDAPSNSYAWDTYGDYMEISESGKNPLQILQPSSHIWNKN